MDTAPSEPAEKELPRSSYTVTAYSDDLGLLKETCQGLHLQSKPWDERPRRTMAEMETQ